MQILERIDIDENISRMELSLAFGNVKRLIKNKCVGDLSETSKKRFEFVRDYLSNTKNTVDSILNNKNDKSFFMTPYFLETSQILNDNIKPTLEEQAYKIKDNIELLLGGLKLLKNNPEMLYDSKDYLSTFHYFNQLSKNFDL